MFVVSVAIYYDFINLISVLRENFKYSPTLSVEPIQNGLPIVTEFDATSVGFVLFLFMKRSTHSFWKENV